MGGVRKLPQTWCDFIGQVGFQLKTLFPCLPPCLVPLSVLAKGSLAWAGRSPSLPLAHWVPVPAVLGAPSRWAALISGLQARGGILQSQARAPLWRERHLVNKHSPADRGGRVKGEESLTFW